MRKLNLEENDFSYFELGSKIKDIIEPFKQTGYCIDENDLKREGIKYCIIPNICTSDKGVEVLEHPYTILFKLSSKEIYSIDCKITPLHTHFIVQSNLVNDIIKYFSQETYLVLIAQLEKLLTQ